MGIRPDQWPAKTSTQVGEDHALVIDRDSDGTASVLIPELRDVLAFGYRRAGSLQTPGNTATTIVDFSGLATGYGAKIVIDLFGDDPSGAGIGSSQLQAHIVNPAGTMVVGTGYGSVYFWSGSMSGLTQPISLTHSTSHLLVQVTGIAATVLNWRAVLSINCVRAL